jgi:hypothetical protein
MSGPTAWFQRHFRPRRCSRAVGGATAESATGQVIETRPMSFVGRKRVHFILQQSLTGALLNGVMSGVVCYYLFSASDKIDLGAKAVLIDLIPQSTGMSFMSFFVPSLALLKRTAELDLPSYGRGDHFRTRIAFQSLLVAVCAGILSVGIYAILRPPVGATFIEFRTFLFCKIAFGASLALVITTAWLALVMRGPRP